MRALASALALRLPIRKDSRGRCDCFCRACRSARLVEGAGA